MTAVFGLVAIAVAVAIVRTARRLRSLTWAITLGLLLGGALGNLGDRIFRSPGFLRGHVVDWIELPHWPVFNLADSAISAAASLRSCCPGAASRSTARTSTSTAACRLDRRPGRRRGRRP